MNAVKTSLLAVLIYLPVAWAGTPESAPMAHSQHHGHHSAGSLSEAGNAVFATVQEVIAQLNKDPKTDWSKVNIEALRQHLLDMNDMALNVEVISQRPIANGLRTHIRATTPRSIQAMNRAFAAHPAQLFAETGWSMKVDADDADFVLTVTTEKAAEVDKIRGLGYFGLMAYGAHHQPHHWMMASGGNPHQMHQH